MRTPYFLDRLGLNTNADERAVKRAYARELKLIDQDADSAGFQSLREAYEEALKWTKNASLNATPVGEAQTSDASPAASSHVESRFTNPSSAEAAEVSFEEILQAVFAAAAAQAGNAEALERILEQSLPEGLEMRERFEHRLALHLAQGWRPGNETLLTVAIDHFDWFDNRRHLLGLGSAGHAMNEAVQEMIALQELPGHERSEYLSLLRELRERKNPPRNEIPFRLEILKRLEMRFPTLLRLLSDATRIESWLKECAAIRAEAQAFIPKTPHSGPKPELLLDRIHRFADVTSLWLIRILLAASAIVGLVGMVVELVKQALGTL
ncbi:MAG: hypothetical protein QM776_18110 [Rhodocyclaceae bacterium]